MGFPFWLWYFPKPRWTVSQGFGRLLPGEQKNRFGSKERGRPWNFSGVPIPNGWLVRNLVGCLRKSLGPIGWDLHRAVVNLGEFVSGANWAGSRGTLWGGNFNFPLGWVSKTFFQGKFKGLGVLRGALFRGVPFPIPRVGKILTLNYFGLGKLVPGGPF